MNWNFSDCTMNLKGYFQQYRFEIKLLIDNLKSLIEWYAIAIYYWCTGYYINRGNVHFTVACLVAKALNKSEAKGDLIIKDKNPSFKCKLCCHHAKNRYWSLP